jgi:ATP-dependent DNA helicase RecG
MPVDKFQDILAIGENIAVEFKRCGGNSVSADTYETVCSFLNRFGGDIYLGVDDNGEIVGVSPKAAPDMVKNFISTVGNPDMIHPTVYLSPRIFEYEGKTLIHIHIHPSVEVHTCRKIIFDRVNDADVKVTATGQTAQMFIRKQKIYTEQKVYPYVTKEHLRLDLLPRVRQMAVNRDNKHAWKDISDDQLLVSARLIGEDFETGQKGFNLAAIMLLGRDEVIKSVCPTYRTDALLRKVNVDRYDDRLIVETNLIDSYNLLMDFAEKHLPDKFYLEDDVRVNLRSKITREMLVNTLMHREFTSSFIAKFIIEREQMFTENANRAEHDGAITPDNFQPNPKNPIIASFFRNVGYADELGSGVRNLYYYVKRYSGKEPQLLDGDVFRIYVPLDESYSFDANSKKVYSANGITINDTTNDTTNIAINETQRKILTLMSDNPMITAKTISESIGITERNVKSNIKTLKEFGLVSREGAKRNGKWVVGFV